MMTKFTIHWDHNLWHLLDCLLTSASHYPTPLPQFHPLRKLTFSLKQILIISVQSRPLFLSLLSLLVRLSKMITCTNTVTVHPSSSWFTVAHCWTPPLLGRHSFPLSFILSFLSSLSNSLTISTIILIVTLIIFSIPLKSLLLLNSSGCKVWVYSVIIGVFLNCSYFLPCYLRKQFSSAQNCLLHEVHGTKVVFIR